MKRLFPFLILIASVAQGALAQSRFQDSLALVDLYNATNGANWRSRTNWLSANPINTWYGVTVNAQGCVEKLVLNDNQLNGRISESISNLTELTVLQLVGNQLNGNIPASLGKLSKLDRLWLTDN
jgi:hypothetical protein